MIEFVIFILPNEIDDLGNTLNRLQEGSRYLNSEQKQDMRLNVTMGISDEIIDWEQSSVNKQKCIDKFNELKPLTDWAGESNFTSSDTINGCTTMRMESSKSNSDYYIWLDSDIIFDPFSIPNIINSITEVEKLTSKFVISPEIVRQWDNTWDCLVNERFLNKEIGYQSKNNPYEDTFIKDGTRITLTEVRNNIDTQPYMKFAGGWFTVISSKFLEEIPFPDGFTHYGLEDTYLMWGAQILNSPELVQYKLKNVIVCENYYDRTNSFDEQLIFIDKREEYKNQNKSLINQGLRSLVR